MKKLLFTALLLTLASAENISAQRLSWTSNDHRTIEARFIGVGSQSVLIEKDGTVFTVPFTRLSADSIAQARRMGGRIGHGSTLAVCKESPKSAIPMTPPAISATSGSSFELRHSSFPSRRLPSSSEWKFLCAYQQGRDVIVHHTIATVFGHDTSLGVKDPNDNGRCASGRGTEANPGILGCALPVSLARRSTVGSPFAQLAGLPWFTEVEVTFRGRTITVQLIDNGPSAPKSSDKIPAGIDLTPAACLALGIPLESIRTNRVSFPVSFRVKGAMRPSLLATN